MNSRMILVNAVWFSGLATSSLLGMLVGCGKTDNSTNAPIAANAPSASRLQIAQGLSEHSSPQPHNTEAYDHLSENPFMDALSHSQSTFAIDVDTASYANVRRMIHQGTKPPTGAVRIEELINYFSYDYPEPIGNRPFSVQTELSACPWNPQHQLLRIGLKGRSVDNRERSACNLVFLLDVSGSMQQANKLPLVKKAMKMLANELNESDRIAIVVYAGASGLALDSTSAGQKSKILAAIGELEASGSTHGSAGIQLAYKLAVQNFIPGGVNRVILCTDGDFNVGVTNQSELVKLIEEKAKSNVFLTVLGFGDGNLKDSTMEKLADRGNGNYAYIDSLLEARKVLVEQIGATLMTIAKDVKIQIDFNPRQVQSYRLLGYENRLLQNQDFRDDAKDAGEIGAGHTVTAFYELAPAGVKDVPNSDRPSEFVKTLVDESADPQTLLTVNLRYKLPENSTSEEFQVRVKADSFVQTPSVDFQFASAVLAYGMLLRESQFAGSANWDWVVATAQENSGEDRSGLRGEFVQLAKTAGRLCKVH